MCVRVELRQCYRKSLTKTYKYIRYQQYLTWFKVYNICQVRDLLCVEKLSNIAAQILRRCHFFLQNDEEYNLNVPDLTYLGKEVGHGHEKPTKNTLYKYNPCHLILFSYLVIITNSLILNVIKTIHNKIQFTI